MPRPRRQLASNCWYHVICRGNRKQRIFKDVADRILFAELLLDGLVREKIVCATYCLMDNHIHLLVRTPLANISRAMQRLAGRYAQFFNQKYALSGHVFQGRFHALCVDSDAYFLAATRYIDLNPVTAGCVTHPKEWKWSGFCSLAGFEEPAPFLSPETVWLQFSPDVHKAQEAYRNFVCDDANTSSNAQKSVYSPFALTLPETSLAHRPDLSEIFVGASTKSIRNELVVVAHLVYQYTCTEIARHVALHVSTVSRIVQKYFEFCETQNAGSDPI